MTRDQALAYCEERGFSPQLTRVERSALNKEEGRMFMLAFSSSDPEEVPQRAAEWASDAIERRERAERLAEATGS